MVRRNHDKQTYVMVCINRETVIYKCHGSQKPRQLLQKVYRFGGQNWILGGYKRTMGGRKRKHPFTMRRFQMLWMSLIFWNGTDLKGLYLRLKAASGTCNPSKPDSSNSIQSHLIFIHQLLILTFALINKLLTILWLKT
jgi:hypothetical protein